MRGRDDPYSSIADCYKGAMTQTLFRRGPVLREVLLALLVLTLTMFNFGHSNFAIATGGHFVVIGSSFCGDPMVPASADHAPCHACRIGGGADLAPPPVVTTPVFVVVCAHFADSRPQIETASRLSPANPRAPPLI
jgi:hypothetical protein